MKANPAVYADLNHFSEGEFEHPEEMDVEFLRRLDHARSYAGIAFDLTSTFRPGDDKAHGLGKAVDIACVSSSGRWRIEGALKSAGFVRIGLYDKHVHADTATAEEGFPQEVLWTGKSK